MDRTAAFYSGPSYRYGGGAMPVFSGSRRHRGGSIFGSLKSFFMPILSSLGKRVAKQGAREAVGLAGDVVKDAFMFKNVNDSLARNAKKRALGLSKYAADEGLNTLESMIGSGKRRRKSRPNLRKRKLSGKRRNSRPIKRRRRTNKTLF